MVELKAFHKQTNETKCSECKKNPIGDRHGDLCVGCWCELQAELSWEDYLRDKNG